MKVYKAQVKWGDSFQELADCWKENKFCDTEQSANQLSWIDDGNPSGLVLLHEYDRCELWNQRSDFRDPSNYRKALFANELAKGHSPWIYWPRHIKNVTNMLKDGVPGYEERAINSIFIGAAENPIQYVNRTKFDWCLAVEHFDFSVDLLSQKPHKYSNIDFLKKIRQAKFGLSLEGYGPKCQRDIEYMANGVVPIFTWTGFNDYHNPLVEDVHYLYAENPREAKEKINSTSKEKWKEMSNNCHDWFQKNCSIKGSFDTTMEIINS